MTTAMARRRPAQVADAGAATAAAGDGTGGRMSSEFRTRVEAQVEAFLHGLTTAEVGSEDFQRRLDAAFRLGRKEIAEATRLSTAFTRESFHGRSDSAAFQAMARLRQLLDELNPGRQGDLLAPVKWFGLIPGGTRLKAYLRRFESCGAQIDRLLEQLSAATDDLEQDVIALDDGRRQMLEALRNLEAAAHFAAELQKRVRARVETLKVADAARARALEQEVLFYASQNLDGLLAQQAVTVNGVLAMETLKKTAREMAIGLDRLKTTGMAALAVAQTVAIATQRQVRTQRAMVETKEVVGDLVVQTSQQLGVHVQTVGKLAADPLLEVQKLQTAFDNTFKALEAMDAIRLAAVDAMDKSNAALAALVDRGREAVQRERRGRDDVASEWTGPVALD